VSGGKSGRYRDAKHPKSLPVAYPRSNDSKIPPAELYEVYSWLKSENNGEALEGTRRPSLPVFGFALNCWEFASIFRLPSYYFGFVTKLEQR